jgi:hypothetical protein
MNDLSIPVGDDKAFAKDFHSAAFVAASTCPANTVCVPVLICSRFSNFVLCPNPLDRGIMEQRLRNRNAAITCACSSR